jgi:hypothetical protein
MSDADEDETAKVSKTSKRNNISWSASMDELLTQLYISHGMYSVKYGQKNAKWTAVLHSLSASFPDVVFTANTCAKHIADLLTKLNSSDRRYNSGGGAGEQRSCLFSRYCLLPGCRQC